MSFISRAYFFFTPYTDAQEQAVNLFFKRLDEHSSQAKTRAKLGKLLQRNIAVINLWTEHRYKGYRYLRKSKRKKLYAKLQLIAEDFDRFFASNARQAEAVLGHIRSLAPGAEIEPQRSVLLQAIMDYLSPARGVYEYRDSSSFGRLLRDPSQKRLVGDCNQIVTLYIYLYSRHYDIHDLQIRALPEHVALHYGGIDIEATNGTFTNYDSGKGNALLPIEEIVSINLLDTTDSYLSTHEVAAEDVLQASRFAFILSHNRDIVTRNLDAAYTKLVNELMQRGSYNKALSIAKASGNMALHGVVAHNGAVYEMSRHHYKAARHFAAKAPKREELIRNSWRAEGAHHYQAHRYHDAIKAFKHIGDKALIRQCYEALFFEEQKKLGSKLTTETIKHHAKTVKHMHRYAQKSGNKQLIVHVDSLKKHL